MSKISSDKDFRDLLAKAIASRRLPEGTCRALKTDNFSRIIKSAHLRRFIYAFNQTSLDILCKFNLINPGKGGRLSSLPLRLTWRQRLSRLVRLNSGKKWPRWMFLLILMATIFNSVRLYHQYIYDANSARLNKLNTLLDGAADDDDVLARGTKSSVEELQLTWSRRAQEACDTLKLMGASHLEWSFLMECALLIFMPASINAYMIFPAVYIMNDMAIMLPAGLLEEKCRVRLRMQLVLHELDIFSSDCLSFVRTKLEQTRREFASASNLFEASAAHNNLKNSHYKMVVASAVQLRRQHRHNIARLRTIALNGGLNPLNGTPDCCDRMALIFLVCLVCTAAYTHATIGIGYVFSKLHFERKGVLTEHKNLKEVLNTVSIFLVLETACLAATLLMVIFVTLIHDLTEAANKLRALMRHVMKQNQIRYELLNWEAMAQTNHCQMYHSENKMIAGLCESFELDHMMIVMQYRLMLRSLLVAKRPLSLILMMATFFTLATPIILRMHTAYFNIGLKLISFLVGLACTSLSYLSICPVGLLHSRSIKTFQEIWSLVAQLSFYESTPEINKYLKIESSVAVFTLRRELADTRWKADRLACRVLLVPITYGSLIKISFWVVLILVSLSNSVNLHGEKYARIMNDPLGLFTCLNTVIRK